MKYLLALFILFSYPLVAQLDKTTYYSFGEQVYFEASPVFYTNTDSTDVLLITKIVNDALTFEKINAADPNSKYRAIAIFEYIIKDKDGIIRKRFETLDTILVAKFEQTESKKDFFTSINKVRLSVNNYSISVQITNSGNRSRILKNTNINLKDKSSKPVFCMPTATGLNDIIPFAFGGDLQFSSLSTRVLIPIFNKTEKNYRYIINKIDSENKDDEIQDVWLDKTRLSSNVDVLENIQIALDFTANKYSLKLIPSDNNHSVLDFEISSNKILPGN